jgi:spore germination protein GerM
MKKIILFAFLLFLINKEKVEASKNNNGNKLILVIENGIVKTIFDEKRTDDCSNGFECEIVKREDRSQHKLKDFIKNTFQRQLKLTKLKDLLTLRY